MNGFNLSDIIDAKLGATTLGSIYLGSTKLWPTVIDYSHEYLTIEPIENECTFLIETYNLNALSTIEIKVNSDPWRVYTFQDMSIFWSDGTDAAYKINVYGTSNTPVTLNIGDKIQFRRLVKNGKYSEAQFCTVRFATSKKYKVYGNIACLEPYHDDVINMTDTYYVGINLTEMYDDHRSKREVYYGLFSSFYTDATYGPKVVDASNLVLPFTTLNQDAYRSMFSDAAYLSLVPALPATTLAVSCYEQMFLECLSLATVPYNLLPATTLAPRCYSGMFNSCWTLTNTPTLPATTLADECYSYMFWGCQRLVNVSTLPATTLAVSCYEQMFDACTSLTSAPELPATILTQSCYRNMFYGCTSLNYIKMLATDISATDCLTTWVYNVAATGIFVKEYNLKSIPINSASGIPTGWTIEELNIDYSQEPFTIEALEDNVTISINNQKACRLTYTKNGGTSQTLTVTANITEALNVTLDNGDICTFTSERWIQYGAKGHFIVSGRFKVYGNWQSLKNYSTSVDQQGCEGALRNNVGLIDASNLVMPATSLGQNAYNGFFRGCTSLVSAPKELPVNGDNSHALMFNECTSLVNPPKLNFTKINGGGCNQMFKGCTSLVKAPDLNVTNVGTWGCYQMFYGCSSLNYVKCMATTKSGDSNFSSWLYGVAASGTFVKDANSTLWGSGSSGIPSGWTITNI